MKFNKAEYSFLALLSALYMVAVFRYQTTPKYVFIATIIFAVSYLCWGVIHHLKAKNFTFRIMLEYFLVAILGVAIVSTLLI